MKSALIDTNILLYYINNSPPWTAKASKVIKNYDCFISIISLLEVAAGWSPEDKESHYPIIKKTFQTINMTEKIALEAGKLRFNSIQKGKKLPALDASIAATALISHLPFITNNPSDFKNIPNLQLLSLDSFEPTALQ